MDATKKEIRRACKEAYSYHAWRNPVGTWFITLYDKDGNGTFKFQYGDNFPKHERVWVMNQLAAIDERKGA